MKKMIRIHLAVLGLGLLTSAGPALAQCGSGSAIPIPTSPTTITSSGCYILSGPVQTAGGPALTIAPTAGSVEIDLAGYLLAASTVTVDIQTTGAVTLRNGTIGDGGPGIANSSSSMLSLTVEDMAFSSIAGAAIAVTDVSVVRIRNNVFIANVAGVVLNSVLGFPSGGLVAHNAFEDSGGVFAQRAVDLNVADNTIDLNRRFGVSLVGENGVECTDCRGLRVTGNIISNSNGSGRGIRVTDSTNSVLSRNQLQENNTFGIQMFNADGCLLEDNAVSASGNSGIAVTGDDCVLRDNLSRFNNDSGILINGSQNVVEHNTLNGNGEAGLWLTPAASDTVIRLNVGQGNNAVPAASPGCTTPLSCNLPDVCNDDASTVSYGDNMTGGGSKC